MLLNWCMIKYLRRITHWDDDSFGWWLTGMTQGDDDSLGWWLTGMMTHWNDDSLGWWLNRMMTHCDDDSPGWWLTRMMTHSDDDSLRWWLTGMMTHSDDDSLGWWLNLTFIGSANRIPQILLRIFCRNSWEITDCVMIISSQHWCFPSGSLFKENVWLLFCTKYRMIIFLKICLDIFGK